MTHSSSSISCFVHIFSQRSKADEFGDEATGLLLQQNVPYAQTTMYYLQHHRVSIKTRAVFNWRATGSNPRNGDLKFLAQIHVSVHSVCQKTLPPETFHDLKISTKCVCGRWRSSQHSIRPIAGLGGREGKNPQSKSLVIRQQLLNKSTHASSLGPTLIRFHDSPLDFLPLDKYLAPRLIIPHNTLRLHFTSGVGKCQRAKNQ